MHREPQDPVACRHVFARLPLGGRLRLQPVEDGRGVGEDRAQGPGQARLEGLGIAARRGGIAQQHLSLIIRKHRGNAVLREEDVEGLKESRGRRPASAQQHEPDRGGQRQPGSSAGPGPESRRCDPGGDKPQPGGKRQHDERPQARRGPLRTRRAGGWASEQQKGLRGHGEVHRGFTLTIFPLSG